MEIFHVPGLSACIVLGDSIVWNNNYGFMNLEDSIPVHDSTLFNVFSIGKVITSACVMQMWDKQLLGLNQNVNDFLPFQIVNPLNNADSITARMLMSHSSSLSDLNFTNYTGLGDPTISLEYFLENYLVSGGEYFSSGNYHNELPGTNYHYANAGTALAGYLIESLTGFSFNQYAHDSLLAPLEMNASAWFLNELNLNNLAIGYTYSGNSFTPNSHYGHPAYPGVTHRSSALDLANFANMLLNEGVFNNHNILSSAAVDSMTTIQNPSWSSSYGIAGLGLFTRDDFGDRIVWGHNGGGTLGYAAQLYFCKEENTAIVVTTNSEQYVDPIVEYLFDYALQIVSTPEIPQKEQTVLNIYPNPSSGSSSIKINLPEKENVCLSVYNINGQIVKNLYQDFMDKGPNELILDCNNLTSGIYLINLKTENVILTKKLIIE
jgi:CubicO group peptidase (beta-lactamase class C family)